MDAETLSSILFFVRLGVVTVFLWVASRVFDLWMDHKRRVADRDAFIRAIYAEVDFNTFDMTRFLDATISLERLSVLFENVEFVPHITDARHTEIYRSRTEELHFVIDDGLPDNSLVGDLVRFYGELEKVAQQIEGLGKPSFKQISVPGKAATIGNIYNTCAACERIGVTILGKMQSRFPQLSLSRNGRVDARDIGRVGDLQGRLAAIKSDLDRVDRTDHKSSPVRSVDNSDVP
mmetsp:Transcript_22928/g.38540  ORF Transcript_22928/g.38540 Transcript_22928/m.38540 type:complete len:234 (-) Transcript_22928:770-1471(-)